MSPAELARKIDHTILKPETLAPAVGRVAAEAMEHQFASACVAPVFVRSVAALLRGSGVATCTVVGFPHGTAKSTIKAIEATSAIKDGADEIDIVAHLPYLMAHDLDSARAELIEVVRSARAARRDVIIKVIVESAWLMSLGTDQGEASILTACRAVRESGCDFIKTSTGFHHAGGATVEAIALMKKHGEGLRIKASGGIRDWATARAMLDAGAERLGTSASVLILNELRRLESE